MVHQRVLVFLVSLFFIKATLSTDSIPIPLESLSVAAESPYDVSFNTSIIDLNAMFSLAFKRAFIVKNLFRRLLRTIRTSTILCCLGTRPILRYTTL